MISEERKAEMAELFYGETNDPESEEWRESLTEEELVLVESWDEAFERGLYRLCKDILDRQKAREVTA